MEFGQILQVVASLGVVALALYLSARLARRRLGAAGGESALRVLSRQSVSRTQNLVVVEAHGRRHLVAFTDGGAHTVESWAAPEPEPVPAAPQARVAGAAGSSFAARLAALTEGTQWAGLARRTPAAADQPAEGTRS